MNWHRSSLAVLSLVLAAVLVLSVLAVAPAGADTGGSLPANTTNASATVERTATTPTPQTTTDGDSTIRLTQRLDRLPDRKGQYAVSHRYRLPSQVGLLEVTLPADASVTRVRGFHRLDGHTYEWDGTTDQPRLDYRLDANRSVDQSGPIAAPGQLLYADVGEWALVPQPRVSHRWGWAGPDRVGLDVEMATENGATGDVMAFLGEHETYTHEAHGQRFRLVVPERASLSEDREAIFASLADASETLRVGQRDDEVLVVAAPTGQVDWGVRGLQSGPADMWVRDIEPLDDPDNVWLHEYVHTRQGYTAAPDLRWSTEGVATYYAALLTLEQEHVTFEQFQRTLARGERDRYADAVLADPGTWQSSPQYPVGALVAGDLDRRIRHSDGDRTFQEVFRRLNARDGVVDGDAFETLLAEAGNESVAGAGRRYTRTTDRPSAWTSDQHNAAFAPLPARITYAVAEDSLAVSGGYRNRTLAAGETVVLVPGERLTVGVNATNFGGTAGEYETGLRVDDTERATRSGSLDPGASETFQFEYTFEAVGTHVLSVGDAQVTVSVRDPARASVVSLSANRTTVEPGQPVQLSATVRNDATRPGELTVPFQRDGEAIASERVRLDAGEERAVTLSTRIETPGTYVFGLGGADADTVVVTVEEPDTDDSEDAENETGDGEDAGDDGDGTGGDGETADGEGPGFGVVAALVGVLVAVLSLRRR